MDLRKCLRLHSISRTRSGCNVARSVSCRKQFEELWLGTQYLPLRCSEDLLYNSCAVRLGEKGMDSPSSPLPPEDCMVSAPDISSAMSDPKLRSSTKLRSLFNNDVDHPSETKTPSEPRLVTCVNAGDNESLPTVGTDAWSLLQDFESLYQPDETTLPNPVQHSPPALPGEQEQMLQLIMESDSSTADYLNCLEQEDCPLFADLDDLDAMLCEAESENTDDATTTTTLDQAAVDALFALEDYPEPQSIQPHTSDLLANLITGTILVDPSLEGLLSNTTLDISSVFGETVIITNCNVGQSELSDEPRNVESCSPASTLQEVPELVFESSNGDIKMERSRKRRISSTASSVCSSSVGTSSVVSHLNADDDIVKTKQQRLSSNVEDKFVEMRKKNNEASRRSRYARKQKFTDLEQEMEHLEKRNKLLTGEADRLEKLVNTLKTAMFKHVQKV